MTPTLVSHAQQLAVIGAAALMRQQQFTLDNASADILAAEIDKELSYGEYSLETAMREAQDASFWRHYLAA